MAASSPAWRFVAGCETTTLSRARPSADADQRGEVADPVAGVGHIDAPCRELPPAPERPHEDALAGGVRRERPGDAERSPRDHRADGDPRLVLQREVDPDRRGRPIRRRRSRRRPGRAAWPLDPGARPRAPAVGACAQPGAAKTRAARRSPASGETRLAVRRTRRAYWAGATRATEDSVAVIASPATSRSTAIEPRQCSLSPNATQLLTRGGRCTGRANPTTTSPDRGRRRRTRAGRDRRSVPSRCGSRRRRRPSARPPATARASSRRSGRRTRGRRPPRRSARRRRSGRRPPRGRAGRRRPPASGRHAPCCRDGRAPARRRRRAEMRRRRRAP